MATTKLTPAEIEALIARNAELEANAAKVEAATKAGFTFRVSKTGALACYGIGGRFPVQLHPDQWATLLDNHQLVRDALTLHKSSLRMLSDVLAEGKAAKNNGSQTASTPANMADTAVARAAERMAQRDASDPNHGK
jgi:hypothetical protein